MATLSRFDPVSELNRLSADLNRWFDGRTQGESVGWTPAVDIFEDTEGVTLKVDLPEVEAKDVDVRLEEGVLTIKGERKFERADQKNAYHRVERSYGTFTRSFALPTTFDFEKVQAESKNGVLRIFVPKLAAAKPRSVQIKVN